MDNPSGSLCFSPQFAVDYFYSAFAAVRENDIAEADQLVAIIKKNSALLAAGR